PILELGQGEVVTWLAPLHRRHLVIWTDPAGVLDLLFRLERLAAFAVKPFVVGLNNVPVVVNLLNELPASLMVPLFAGLDEVVEADLERAPYLLELAGHVVAVFLRVAAHFGSLLGHLDGVLVVAHQEMDLVTLHAPIAGLDVGADLFE